MTHSTCNERGLAFDKLDIRFKTNHQYLYSGATKSPELVLVAPLSSNRTDSRNLDRNLRVTEVLTCVLTCRISTLLLSKVRSLCGQPDCKASSELKKPSRERVKRLQGSPNKSSCTQRANFGERDE